MRLWAEVSPGLRSDLPASKWLSTSSSIWTVSYAQHVDMKTFATVNRAVVEVCGEVNCRIP